jgi:ADP-ribose pyrophosphatase
MVKTNLEPWEVLSTGEVFAAEPWIKVYQQTIKLPSGKIVPDYHKIVLPDFAAIFAETEDGRVVVERQYKHGIGRVSLVIPAGQVNEGEEPLAAAKRELLEETGYEADNWKCLGSFGTHGSYGCGNAHVFKATNARRVAEPDSGDLEDMEILLMTKEELIAAVTNGDIGLVGTAAVIALATNPLINPS